MDTVDRRRASLLSCPGKSAKRVFAPGDPGIPPLRKILAKAMDCRVKPGNDRWCAAAVLIDVRQARP
jgi:hypothetical protein